MQLRTVGEKAAYPNFRTLAFGHATGRPALLRKTRETTVAAGSY